MTVHSWFAKPMVGRRFIAVPGYKVAFVDGSSIAFSTRERPKFVYADSNNMTTPVALITGVSAACSPPSQSPARSPPIRCPLVASPTAACLTRGPGSSQSGCLAVPTVPEVATSLEITL